MMKVTVNNNIHKALKEFKKIQKMYANVPHDDTQDMLTFAFNMYNDQMKEAKRLKNFWRAENIAKFLNHPYIKYLMEHPEVEQV